MRCTRRPIGSRESEMGNGNSDNGRSPVNRTTSDETVVVNRTTVAAPPELLSQKNVESVTGVPARTWLESMLPAFEAAGGEVGRHGRLRFVRRETFCDWLMRCRQPVALPAEDGGGLAVELGLRLVGGGR